nr:hypothetical protein [Tanacetum cinerariifolium]
MGANYREASRGTERGMDVRRIEEEVEPDFLSDAHSRTSPAKSGDSYKSKDGSFRICMDYRKLSEIAIRNRCHQMGYTKKRFQRLILGCVMDTLSLHEVKGGARVAFEDEFRAAEEREVLCEAQQRRSRVKRKLFESFRNKIDEAVARLGVHVSSIPDRDGMYIKLLARDVEVVRNASRYEYCLPSID